MLTHLIPDRPSQKCKDALQRDLLTPTKFYAKRHFLHEGVEAPDLATVKDFFVSTSLRATAGL
jgi:hypothetical protein